MGQKLRSYAVAAFEGFIIRVFVSLFKRMIIGRAAGTALLDDQLTSKGLI